MITNTHQLQKTYKDEIHKFARKPIMFGFFMVLAVCVVFGAWAGFAPLDSAAVAPGSVVLHLNKKTIQHLEGGIIADIMIKEGDYVEIGQPLIYLNDTSAKAREEILLTQHRYMKATEARLIAERDNTKKIPFDKDLIMHKKVPDVRKLLVSQIQLLKSNRLTIKNEIDVLQEKIEQLSELIKGLESQIKESNTQRHLIFKEIETVKSLLEKGLEKEPRLLALQRQASELRRDIAKSQADIAQAKSSIQESQLQIIKVQRTYMRDVLNELKEVQTETTSLKEELLASKDVLERTVILAPQSGIVNGLQYHTIGGVIEPGHPIMDIIPQDDKLIIEAMVSPLDIDVVHEGLIAKVALSSYRARFVPRLDGKVTKVSANTFTDEKDGSTYYTAKVEIDSDALKTLKENILLQPGMPAEVFIVTGTRTFLQYLIDPIEQSFSRAFKEE